MRQLILPLVLATGLAGPVSAQDFLAPLQDFVEDLTPRRAPAQRPETPEPAKAETPEAPPPIPRPRPDDLDAAAEDEEAPAPQDADDPGPAEPDAAPVEPEEAPAIAAAEPDRIYQVACPALLSGKVSGEMLPPIDDGVCQAQSPLLITALNLPGRTITLSEPITTNCGVAGELVAWAAEVDAYAAAALDSGLVALSNGPGFVCRNRYGAEDGFVSEHGFANAVDIAGLTLADGRVISVKADWPRATTPEGKLLRQSHGAACGKFTTVLGPEANADHEDHLHFDLGCHGQTCTAQICE